MAGAVVPQPPPARACRAATPEHCPVGLCRRAMHADPGAVCRRVTVCEVVRYRRALSCQLLHLPMPATIDRESANNPRLITHHQPTNEAVSRHYHSYEVLRVTARRWA